MVGSVQNPHAARRPDMAGRRLLASRPLRARAAGALALLGALASIAGCGGALDARPAAHVTAAAPAAADGVSNACASAALSTLVSVLERVYHEGVLSERTASAQHLIANSLPLRAAVEAGNRPAARAAARTLLKTGHLTNVTIVRGNRTLVDMGGPALAPLHGTLEAADGTPIASYTASVWADSGFLMEAGGITQGIVALRSAGGADNGRIAGSPPLPAGVDSSEGALTHAGVAYRYTSFPVLAYPSGSLRAYLLMPSRTLAKLCGASTEDTAVNTLRHVAELIYASELGRSAHIQVRRVQRNRPLLEAVAHRDSEATRLAIDALLNQHIVRLRVNVEGRLLRDVGGPYVLAPVSAPLRLGGHTIGRLTLSIQDDEGYLRLARRLAGLDVLMYMNPAHPQLVKDSLGPMPGPALASVPASGSYRYAGRDYRVFTVNAQAFPSGPLVIRVLVPLPYPS